MGIYKYSTRFYIMGNICEIRPTKKVCVVQVTPCKKIRVGKHDNIIFLGENFFFLEYSDLLGNVLNKTKLI